MPKNGPECVFWGYDIAPEAAALATHTSDPHDFATFRDKGRPGSRRRAKRTRGRGVSPRGRSLGRGTGPQLRRAWIGISPIGRWLHAKPISRMFYGRGDVGPAGLSLLVKHPNLFRRLPHAIQTRGGARAIRPAGSERLIDRTRGVTITTGRFLTHARVAGHRLHIRLDDVMERAVDHVVLGTGYRVDIRHHPFLSSSLLDRLDVVDGYPRLDAGFESSLPGLHFLGVPAAWSFGPPMRFVAGTEFTSRALTRRIRRDG